MARTLWNGTLELGDLAIPVGLVSTVSDGSVKFATLHAACGRPAAVRFYCEEEEELLEADDLVKGWESSPGAYLIVTDKERELLELAESRRMPIGCFVAAADLDLATLARRRYRLVPSKTTVGRRAYALLADAIHTLDVAALVRYVAWRSEQIAAVVCRDGAMLELVALHFAEDLVDAPKLEPVDGLDDHLRQLTHKLVDLHTRKLRAGTVRRLGDLDSGHRREVRALLEAKIAGETLVWPTVEKDERATLPSIDLEAALERSMKRAPRRRRTATATA